MKFPKKQPAPKKEKPSKKSFYTTYIGRQEAENTGINIDQRDPKRFKANPPSQEPQGLSIRNQNLLGANRVTPPPNTDASRPVNVQAPYLERR
jgi:hypothetical protein